MDAFLKSMGFNAVQRATAMRAGQVQVIKREGDNLRIVTHDLRGSYELVLPLGGHPVEGEGDRPDETVARQAYVDRQGDIVITETASGDREPCAVCRRSLRGEDGKMVVDIRKRCGSSADVASMRIVFSRRSQRAPDPDGS